MKTLHHDNDRATPLVIETRQKGVVIPIIDALSFGVREGLNGFQGIIDDDEVASSSRQSPVDTRRQAVAVLCRGHLKFGVLDLPDARRGEEFPIPVTVDDRPKIACM